MDYTAVGCRNVIVVCRLQNIMRKYNNKISISVKNEVLDTFHFPHCPKAHSKQSSAFPLRWWTRTFLRVWVTFMLCNVWGWLKGHNFALIAWFRSALPNLSQRVSESFMIPNLQSWTVNESWTHSSTLLKGKVWWQFSIFYFSKERMKLSSPYPAWD